MMKDMKPYLSTVGGWLTYCLQTSEWPCHTEFRRSLDLSTSEDNMKKFHDIQAAIHGFIHEHLDVMAQWWKQSQDARDAFKKAVSPSHIVLFIINNCVV